MPSIDLGFTTSATSIVLLVLAAITVATLFYRYTLPPVPPAKKTTLIALRAGALSLLLLLLFEPTLRLTYTSDQLPTLAVLIDDSQSMTIVDRTGSRSEQLAGLLTAKTLERAAATGNLRRYTFGAALRAQEPTDSLRFNDGSTDISLALRLLAKETERYNIRAAVLLTDGAYNLGQNPIHDAEASGIPLYTVGIGDSSEQKDILITKVITNSLVYGQTEVPVDITIRSSGFTGQRVEVSLSEGGKELSRKPVLLNQGTGEYSVRLSYVPEGEGVKKYVVRVSGLPGELTSENNRRSFLAKVLKSRLHVVILAGGPGPDLSVIRQTVAEDTRLDVVSFAQRMSSGFYEGSPGSGAIDTADCMMLIGFPTAGTPSSLLDLVRSALVQNSKPVLFVAGKSVDYGKLASIAPHLPFTASGYTSAEQLVFFQPSAAQKGHPLLSADGEAGIDVWNQMPPIFKSQTSFKATPEAVVLGFSRTQNLPAREPLVLLRSVGAQKSIAVLGYGLWRWRLMAQGSPPTEHLLSSFLANSIRWLTTKEDSRPVKVGPTKETFTQGEPIEFAGQVYDLNQRPFDNADVRVTATHEGKDFETVLRPLGNGRYEGTVDGLGHGDFTYRAVAYSGDQYIGDDRGRFSVGELNLEFQDSRMNASLLRQLAFRTGGTYHTAATFASLADTLASLKPFSPRQISSTTNLELWNWQYSLAVVVLLLAAEWFMRKRSGMV